MKSLRAIGLKFTVFAVVTMSATVFLFMTFAQYRTGRSNGYSAVFADASRLKPGDSVRAAGIRIGTVDTVTLRADTTALVTFEADRDVVLTTATKAAVRYLNLVGDRYLELVDAPGSAAVMPAGSQILVDRTQPALDLDLLLSGLKPVIASLSPQDVNALTSALVHILQGEGGTVESLFAKTSSFTNALADNDGVIRELIENLKVVLSSLTSEGDRFSTALDRVEKLITGFAGDRDPVGAATDALDAGTASLAGLLASARPPLAGAVNELSRLAPLLDQDKERLDRALAKAPDNYRKLTRLGAYGSFIAMYVCGMSVRVTDLEGRTAVFPWIKQTGGRCAEP
ncbi:mammalian cell entry protein [Mycobacterium sp. WY10]|nr:mammalian cell entry protein [Mycobacterium sp. WY10]